MRTSPSSGLLNDTLLSTSTTSSKAGQPARAGQGPLILKNRNTQQIRGPDWGRPVSRQGLKLPSPLGSMSSDRWGDGLQRQRPRQRPRGWAARPSPDSGHVLL